MIMILLKFHGEFIGEVNIVFTVCVYRCVCVYKPYFILEYVLPVSYLYGFLIASLSLFGSYAAFKFERIPYVYWTYMIILISFNMFPVLV